MRGEEGLQMAGACAQPIVLLVAECFTPIGKVLPSEKGSMLLSGHMKNPLTRAQVATRRRGLNSTYFISPWGNINHVARSI